MKEIKFRAWDKGDGKWIDNLEFAIDPTSGKLLAASGDEMVWSNHSNYELMQYTGLKDKNGVEIYEGDIIKTELTMYGGKNIGVVEYIQIDGAFAVQTHTSEIYTVGKALKLYGGEVIGNIYQNPELLKPLDNDYTV